MKTAKQWLEERDESIKNFKVMDAVRFIEEIQKDAIERPFKSCATCGYVMKTKHYCPECETKLQEPMSQQLPNQAWTTDQSPDHRSPDPRQPPNPPALKPCPFCGGPAETRQDIGFLWWPGEWDVLCSLCNICLSGWHNTESRAIEIWNYRYNDPNL